MINSSSSLETTCGINTFYNTFKRGIPFHLQKSIPENFIVKEILPNMSVVDSTANLGESETGLFFHTILTKRLIDTPGAIKLISKELRIPLDWIGYAGLKDSQGITSQRISIFNTNQHVLSQLSFNNFWFSNFIRKRYEINLGDLWGNRFTIKMNALSTSELSEDELAELSTIIQNLDTALFPNFFGLQRFGTTRPVSHLVGKALLLNDFQLAVKTYLLTVSPHENEKITMIRKKLSEDWDYTFFLANIPRNYHYETIMARSLQEHPNNYFKAFNQIPARMKKFFVSSYQSYIFNQLLSKYIEHYTEGEELIEDFPIISSTIDVSSLPNYLIDYLELLLHNDGISFSDFQNTKISQNFKKNHYRKTFIRLTDFDFNLTPENLTLSFSLPKSSYATMVIREIERK